MKIMLGKQYNLRNKTIVEIVEIKPKGYIRTKIIGRSSKYRYNNHLYLNQTLILRKDGKGGAHGEGYDIMSIRKRKVKVTP